MRGYSCIGLHNPKFACNVGSVLRLAKNFDCAFVAHSGKRYRKHGTDTMKTWRHIPLFQVEDLRNIIPYDCVPIAVELLPEASSIIGFKHPKRAFYIFGGEDETMGKKVISWCKEVIYVPTKLCMNLAVTAGVVLYDRLIKEA